MPKRWESASTGVSKVDLFDLVADFRSGLLASQDPAQVLFKCGEEGFVTQWSARAFVRTQYFQILFPDSSGQEFAPF